MPWSPVFVEDLLIRGGVAGDIVRKAADGRAESKQLRRLILNRAVSQAGMDPKTPVIWDTILQDIGVGYSLTTPTDIPLAMGNWFICAFARLQDSPIELDIFNLTLATPNKVTRLDPSGDTLVVASQVSPAVPSVIQIRALGSLPSAGLIGGVSNGFYMFEIP